MLTRRTSLALFVAVALVAPSSRADDKLAPKPDGAAARLEWIADQVAAHEVLRGVFGKPRIAESKRLLKEKSIEPASIPADVLDAPDLIGALIGSVEALPVEFRPRAYQRIAAALSKGFEDAEIGLAPFAAAAILFGKWSETGNVQQQLRDLALKECAVVPEDAMRIVSAAKEACELVSIAEAIGIIVPSFPSVEEGRESLSHFNNAYQGYETKCDAEGLGESERASVKGMSLEAARVHVESMRVALDDEKTQLQTELVSLERKLTEIGLATNIAASTIAELRSAVGSLQHELARRREELQEALGNEVFVVVESVSRGNIPARESVGDEEFGAALRQAVDCGYRLTLEAPRED